MVTFCVNKISKIVREHVDQYNTGEKTVHTCVVLQVGNNIACIYDLNEVMEITGITDCFEFGTK